ncbi:MAG: hypothetical protein WCT31_04630 [Candidatus Micrarchaeia archaeon]
MKKPRRLFNIYLIYLLWLFLFVGLSIFLKGRIDIGSYDFVTIGAGLIWLFSLVIVAAFMLYNFFSKGEIIFGYLPFTWLAGLLSQFLHGSIVKSWNIMDGMFIFERYSGKQRSYEINKIKVIREGRRYGDKSIFTFKSEKRWIILVFDGDMALLCSKKLRKALASQKLPHQY